MEKKFNNQSELVGFVVDLEEKVDKVIRLFNNIGDSIGAQINEVAPKVGIDFYTEEEKNALFEELYQRLPPPVTVDEQKLYDKLYKALSKFKPEKTIIREITREVPVVTNEIKEVAVNDAIEKTRDKLEALPDGEKLRIDAIENLRDELNDLLKRISSARGGYGGASFAIKGIVAGSNITIDNTKPSYPIISSTGGGGAGVTAETPSGTVDGSNATFTVSNEPSFVIIDGMFRVSGFGYTYSGGTITVDPLTPPTSFIRSYY